ncbi:hypothetical protein MNBD_PLANCTO03-1463 [hydrothermal vent metagenome]|uniref:Uncharacterized protein n=1 Tax=hydrothermal vent metagenome TaxID=652676 RepID=A0A3B1DSM3_9ZZZZ
MDTPTRSNSLNTYQVVLYDRALHPEFFELKTRRVERLNGFEFEAWLMNGAHVLRFESGSLCASELVTDQERGLPDTGVVTAFLCAGERDYDHSFAAGGLGYITTVQTETLAENLYLTTYEELLAFGREGESLIHQWEDDVGPCLSMLDMQRLSTEMHVQAYHLLANQGIVLRTQTIFEQKKNTRGEKR